MKFEDPETGNKVVEIVKVFFLKENISPYRFFISFFLRQDLSQVNLTKPEKRGRERKAKAHLESPKADDQVAITIDNNLLK